MPHLKKITWWQRHATPWEWRLFLDSVHWQITSTQTKNTYKMICDSKIYLYTNNLHQLILLCYRISVDNLFAFWLFGLINYSLVYHMDFWKRKKKIYITKRKLKRWWTTTIPQISTKQTITSHFNWLNTK